MSNNKQETREDFCGLCVTTPLALLGAGVAGGAQFGFKQGRYQQARKIAMVVGVTVSILSILITIYFLTKNKCSSCISS